MRSPGIYVINLPRRVDRLGEMRRQLLAVGWRGEFFSAIRPDTAAGFPSVGARGCFLSHLAVLKRAHEARVERLVILEDDLNFVRHFPERWECAMAELEQREWSIFYAGHIFESAPLGLTLIPPDIGVQCAHFMVVNGPAIRTLVKGLELILARPPGHPLGGPMHVDGAYSTLRLQNESLITYIYSPTLGYQRPSRTDIGELRWFDTVRMLRPIVKIGRRLKSIWKR